MPASPQNEIIETIHERSRTFFRSGRTMAYTERRAALDKLGALVREKEDRILDALKADFAKSRFEAWTTEIGTVLQEISYARKRLKRWMRPRRVPTPVSLWPARSRIVPHPWGSVLVIAPWNYPIQLALSPIVSALAAGNTVVLKPSELTPACSALLAEMLGDRFDTGLLQVVEGDAHVGQALLERHWDYIFFTGSPRVGRLVYKAAAEHGTPVTLELGGKNACVIAADADLTTSAKRVVWGKFLNAGQTCVAPDYLLVERARDDPARAERVIESLSLEITRAYGATPIESPDLPSIVNQAHYERLTGFLERGRIRFGGRRDPERKRIEPTIVDGLAPDDPVLQEEIFGPVLPVVVVDSLTQAREEIENRAEGLAAYYFGSETRAPEILERLRFGGGCSNDTILHVANPNLPFGGSGPSGIGRYHGRYGFEAFSHQKSLLYAPRRFDIPWRYAPYTERRLRLLKRVLG